MQEFSVEMEGGINCRQHRERGLKILQTLKGSGKLYRDKTIYYVIKIHEIKIFQTLKTFKRVKQSKISKIYKYL